ncbi:reverse transcriptase domain-containing protein [Tanacetum coccineum]|uniref:Reverse transcriptase domain-containing protein n=1 Tax=Tanacetum coccineum TaxID=301880 RepID=A0ABQ5AP32_9ASTR
MLGEHNITYRPRTLVKGHILAEFLIEKPDENLLNTPVVATPPEPWTLFTDGSSCVDRSGAGLILTDPEGTEFTYALRFQFTASNNKADKNKKADALSKIASTSFAHLSKQVLVEVLQEKSIQEKVVKTVVEEDGPTWMTPTMEYMKDGTLPGDKKEASKLHIKARHYELMEGTLCRRSFLKSWLRTTVSSSKGYATRILLADHAPRRKRYDTRVQRLSSTSPYTKRSAIIANPNHGSVAVLQMGNRYSQYFPGRTGKSGEKVHIGQHLKHPQSNGLVERANRSLGEGIKARLGEGNKNCLEELPHVLWAHRTMIKSSHGDTPFSLTYGMEAVIASKIGMPTYRTVTVDTVHNDEELQLNLDLLEEKREHAAICEAKSKMKMAKYYNARVCGVAFRPEVFVYRTNDASHTTAKNLNQSRKDLMKLQKR